MPVELLSFSDGSPGSTSLPLSAAQTDVWRAQKLAPENAKYNVAAYQEIFGAIDRRLFEAAIRQAIGESDTHNSRFVETKEGPRQISGFRTEFKIPFMDFSREADARAAAIAWMQAAMYEPFDLENGPLFRFALIRIADDRSFWFMIFHHIITDLVGSALLYPRVADLYNSSIDGQERPLERTSWLEFLNDEQDYGNSPRFKRDRDYWRDALRGYSPAVTLSGKPPAWPGPTIESGGKISRSLVVELERLGAAHQASFPTVLYAMMAAYLSRMTGANDVILGMPVTGRTSGKLRRVHGFLANVVPLRLIVDPHASIGSLLQQAGIRAREALRHQRYWAAALRADLNLSAADPNIYGTVINFVSNDSTMDFAGGQSARLTVFTHSRLVEDLGVTVHARSDESDIVVQFGAHRDHYDPPSLQRHRERFLELLESAVRHPDAPMNMLPFLTISERGLVSKDWTGAGINFDHRTFPEIFAAQAARSPHAVALALADQELSYAELNSRAERLARRLIDAGVGAETLVGLCIERSMDMIVGVLGIWKACAAYLPLDLTYPAERLKLMLDDARPVLIVSSAAAAAEWTVKGYPQLVLDAGESQPAESDAAARTVAADDAAYVIYTSGSSGTPKGVLVTHRGVAALAAAQIERCAIGSGSRVLQFASLNFDASVWDIVTALSSGATLVLTPAAALSGDALHTLLATQRVSHALLPPAVLPTIKPTADLALKYLVVGGEACPPALVDEWSKRMHVINAYGPTECTVCATMSEPLHGRAAVPIGKPIAGTRVYVLDDMLQHAPIGAAGEIYIAGAGLARGYLNRPTLTAERFVADPYAEPGCRMYRSGDLARWRGDGQLEFLGRVDNQVKIRGFRVELGEIESALLKQDGIEQAAVVSGGDAPGRRQLAAYLVCRAGFEPNAKVLRGALAQTLPEHMIPAAFVSLAALPLSPSGKLDRRALPIPGDESRSSGSYEAAQGPKEEAIAAVWSDLLHVERVGRHDSFFEIGGDSLLLVEVIERLRLRGWRVEARSVFDQPTVCGLGAVIEPLRARTDVPPNRIAPNCERITPAMLPLISLDQAQIDGIVARIAGGARNVEDIYPLAPLQEGILLHHRLSNDTDAYLASAILSFDTFERAGQFAAALQTVVDRHDVLRTAMQWEGLPEPAQIVLRHARVPVEKITLSGANAAEELWSKRRLRIDVGEAPLLRMQLAEDASQGRWLGLLQFHHLVIDNSTLGLILSDVIAQLRGSYEPAETVPFRDFVAESRLGVSKGEHLKFFREMLGDFDEPTAPFGLLEVRGNGLDVEEARLPLQPEMARAVRANARRLGVTPSSLFHLAWALVLARTSAREDIVFGTVLFGRMHGAAGLDRAFGLFINTLPFRLQIHELGVSDAVRLTHARLGQLVKHEHASLAAVQRCSALPGSAPLFSALLNFRHAAAGVAATGAAEALGVKLIRAEERTNYPLALYIDDLGVDFALTVQSSRDVDPARICGFVETALKSLLQALEENPTAAVRSLPVLSEPERGRVLAQSGGSYDALSAKLFPQQFEAQVMRTPDAVAVTAEGRGLTYSELNAWANRVAHRLIELGIRPGDRVGLCATRTPALLAGLLGIQKSGGAYVPLDPEFPVERLNYMLADSGAKVLLVSASLPPELQLPHGVTLLELSSVADDADENPSVAVNSNDLAYVIYTSGSTGLPKGVAVPHGALLNFLWSMRQRPGLAAEDVLAAVTTVSFDIAALELYLPLTMGARIELVPRHVAADGNALAKLLATSQATTLQATPATWRMLLRAGWSGGPGFRALCGGEEMPRDLADALLPRVGELWNLYGPTETTVWSAVEHVQRAAEKSVPIGRAVRATQLYVLDGDLEPAPVGAAGELYIAGEGLARGYFNRPALTAERFVPNPYGEPGSRMYRTGDVARWRGDGALEYLGRNDRQVKIRGFRIELGEIEAVLRSAPGIREAAVMACEEPDSRFLAAYVVAADQPGQSCDPQQLRSFLAQRLPAHMIPTRYISLAALPLTPGGKIDRRALPAPDGTGRSSRSYEAPQTRTEEQLAAIWRDILRVGRIGRTDDFFDMGGHSLTALQVASRARDVFGVELPLINMFEARTLEALAAQIDHAVLSKQYAPRLAALKPIAGKDPAPLSYSQERMWLIQSLNPHATAYNMASFVHLRGAMDLGALSTSFEDLIRRHDILRTSIRTIDDRPMQVLEAGSGPALQVVDLRGVANAEAEARRQGLLEARAPFDLSRGPVVRAQLFQLDGDVYFMNLVFHHIAVDQWSMGVLGRELAALYNGRRRGQPIQLAELPINYRDYSIWQRSGAFASEFTRQLSYWHAKLANLPTLDLATDHPRPPVWTLNGSFYDLQFSPELFARIEQFGRGSGSTTFMTLFAAFAVMLHRLTGQGDIPIGVPVANRSHSLMEGLVGTFVNTVVLRNDLTGDPGFGELLQRVRTTALDAFSQQDVPFDRLVQELGQRGDRSRAPLVQVLFNVTNAPMHGVEFDGVTLEALPMDRGGAQFELSFSIDTEVTRRLSIEYNTDLFEHATIERLAAQYLTLLQAATAEPLRRISTLPLLAAEQRATLDAWNSTQAAYPSEMFPRIFETQALKSPQAIAISFAGTQMSYGGLNASANILALQLCELGAGPGTLVALCVDRSPLLLICLLAIQKSGAGYVPLDPEFPAERLSYMLIDSGSELLLTSGEAPAGVEVPAGVRTLDAAAALRNTTDIENTAASAQNLARAPVRQDIAYVIYTSGSTGRPKGVAITHGALVNFLCSMRERPGISSGDVLAAVTTISFDIAALELYLPLLVGARVELVSRRDSADGHALSSLLGSSGTTLLQATPATWRMLLEVEWSGGEEFRALCGGEALSRNLADGILERVGELWNMYGPTETTVWSTLEQIGRNGDAISIGRPIGNTQVHILDLGGQIVPIGAVGEICIGGEGVANGYHRRPALTAERFVPDVDAAPGQRLYRTGDSGRWAGDGKLYHLGRMDNQVKIRGFRIELNEIEEVFGAFAEVRQVVVVVREAQAEDARLVAFVTYNEGRDLTTGDVKQKLRLQLPEYMVPSIIVPVASMPLTPNGKVDRAALPNPFDNAVSSAPHREPPATDTERIIADIWRDVLKVERIDAEDNFFELGGYSLLSLRVAKMVKKRTGREMDPRTLFFHNLRQVAALLEPS
jgi:amino acid adenylation domain-containing protein